MMQNYLYISLVLLFVHNATPKRDVHIERLSNNNKNAGPKGLSSRGSSCWMSFKAKKHFDKMNQLDAKYEKVRQDYQRAVENDNFDKEMLGTMITKRGVAMRAEHTSSEQSEVIPAGLNLGGFCMMRLPDSVLFFHRMKLRNNTHFQVDYLHNDLMNMRIVAHLTLNDLHLRGSYERAQTDIDPSVLFYVPTYGVLELLLKHVTYKMEGRYRLLRDKLSIEIVISEIKIRNIIVTYINNGSVGPALRVLQDGIDDFVDRMKTDLNAWIKDYFNDYLLYFELPNSDASSKLLKYDKEKAIALNEYAEDVIQIIKNRLNDFGTTTVRAPQFTIYEINGGELKLRDGVLHGLDTMYRRSVATGRRDKNTRYVDVMVGFSNIKLSYKFDAVNKRGGTPFTGTLVLSANDLSAHMGLSLISEPEAGDLQFDSLHCRKSGSLIVNGPAAKLLVNFRHLLEVHVISIMSNAILHNVKLLSGISQCEPPLRGFIEPAEARARAHNEKQLLSNNIVKITTNDLNEYNNDEKHDNVNNENISKEKYAAEPMKINVDNDEMVGKEKLTTEAMKSYNNTDSKDGERTTDKTTKPKKMKFVKITKNKKNTSAQ